VWCRRDTNIITYCLSEIPGLLVAIRQDALYGTPTRGATRRGSSAPSMPGQTALLAVDATIETLTAIEDELRHLRRYSPRPVGHDHATIAAAIQLLTAHIDWLTTDHPGTADPETSPGALILRLHWKLQRIAKADPQRPQRSDLDCPSCQHKALALAPGDDSYECAICGRRLRLSEYHEYVKEAAAALV
jgi:hypothetical protein